MDKAAQSQLIIGIDGHTRSKTVEDRLNSVFAGLFSSGAGTEVLNYLQGITMHTVVPSTESGERLRHQEGMRDLFRIIKERINKGKEGNNDTGGTKDGSGTGAGRRSIQQRKQRRDPAIS